MKVVIIGGGISGLAAAYFLSRKGFHPTLVEKTPRLGGLIRTDHVDSCELEAGPDSFLAAKPEVAELARELGIEHDIIGSNDQMRRVFIWRREKLVAMPKGMVMMIPGDLGAAFQSPLFGIRSKILFAKELSCKPRHRDHDVSVQEFVSEHFGQEVVDYVAEPLLSGVYGGNVAHLSTAAVLPRFLEYEKVYGSLIRAVRGERNRSATAPIPSLFLSFTGGMQALTTRLSAEILASTEIRHTEATRVDRNARGWSVQLAGECIPADHVVLACSSHVSARLLTASDPNLATRLAAISYSSAILVTCVFDRKHIPAAMEGFGFLVPRRERRVIAAASWISTKFPSRTPSTRFAFRAFIVGAEANALLSAPDTELIRLVKDELLRMVGLASSPLSTVVHRWPDSMPQYEVGHQDLTERIQHEIANCPGLHVCGNAFEGVGIPDCVRMARKVAERIATAS